MLVSAILQLSAEVPARLPVANGALVHGWFLRTFLRERDPELADALHRPNQQRPFTLSMLGGGRREAGTWLAIKPGDPCLVRITAMGMRLASHVVSLAGMLGTRVILGGHSFVIDRVTGGHPDQEQPIAMTFAALGERWALCPSAPRLFALRFTAPTVFRAGRGASPGGGGRRESLPFPLPSALGRALAERWNEHAPPAWRLRDPLAIASSLHVVSCRIRTESLAIRRGPRHYHEVGFVGDCTFGLDGSASEELVRAANALADFATYCGVGASTAIGMGQVYRPAQPHEN
jgi:CRISPR-associated endoribonuclease Cas6